MNRTWHLRIRKSHRYLGLFIGVQFLLWNVVCFFFIWSKLDDINGEHLTRPATALPLSLSLVSPSASILTMSQQPGRSTDATNSITGVQLIEVLGQPVYQINYRTVHKGGHAMTHTQLADARTGKLRGELTKAEATVLAQRRFAGSSAVERVEYLTSTDGHHEYRQKPLPAYAVTFRQPAHATIYVAAQLGTVQSVRTDPWRIFDVLWMLHTMDYEGRDDINNSILRSFSLLGLLTISSGFALYFISSPQLRRKSNRAKRPVSTNS